jgi:hypothetical protein
MGQKAGPYEFNRLVKEFNNKLNELSGFDDIKDVKNFLDAVFFTDGLKTITDNTKIMYQNLAKTIYPPENEEDKYNYKLSVVRTGGMGYDSSGHEETYKNVSFSQINNIGNLNDEENKFLIEKINYLPDIYKLIDKYYKLIEPNYNIIHDLYWTNNGKVKTRLRELGSLTGTIASHEEMEEYINEDTTIKYMKKFMKDFDTLKEKYISNFSKKLTGIILDSFNINNENQGGKRKSRRNRKSKKGKRSRKARKSNRRRGRR